ncbi:hypothetical protein D3C84_1313240 [compost metagenome]
MIEHAGECVLLWRGGQWRWSFEGYRLVKQPIPDSAGVTVLTPEPIVRLFAAGLQLQVHESVC